MDFDSNITNDNNDVWSWAEGDYSLQGKFGLDISGYLLDDLNQTEESVCCMLDKQTPSKDWFDSAYGMINMGDCTSKVFEQSGESSQLKTRRMLQFPSESYDPASVNGLTASFYNPKAREELTVQNVLPESMDWNPQWSSGVSGDGCSMGNEELNHSLEGCQANCLNDNGMYRCPEEINDCVTSTAQLDISEFRNIPTEIGANLVQKAPTPSRCRIFRGRKSFISLPTKITTSVAYPFALIKPCAVEGDVTLKDINQMICAPPPSKLMNQKDDDSSMSYPTSAFTGKPVVAKTRILTEGGKGSITIMRTKG